MVPNITRGQSFKGLTDYLRHDKEADSAERIGFVTFENFHDGEADSIEQAAKVMALTVRDAEWLKERAGVRPGGTKAEGPPVWHMSLSWEKGEQVDRAEMERAAAAALAEIGLGLVRGYQTVMVEHTDTDHQHLHVMVNLVHPVTGKQANPWRDRQKSQQWARSYEKGRGAIFCHDREAKYAEIDRQRAKSATQASFTDAAKGGRPKQARRGDPDHQPTADQFGRDRSKARQNPRAGRLPRHQWEAQQQAKREAKEAEFQRVKAEIGTRYAAMRAAETAGRAQRNAEYQRLRADREAGRAAIRAKYDEALESLSSTGASHRESSPEEIGWRFAWQRIETHVAERKAAFERREGTVIGRWLNARALAPKSAGIWTVARLAVNEAERRRLFERDQKRTRAKMAPPAENRPKPRPRPNTPIPKAAMARNIRAMRAAELARYDAETRATFAAMKARHQFERQADDARRAAFAAASKAAWDQFNAAHPSRARPAGGKDAANQNQTRDGDRQDSQAEQAQPKADRFGRSRNRAPRERRAPEMRLSPDDRRGAVWTRPAAEPGLTLKVHLAGQTGAEAENLPVEAVPASDGIDLPASTPEAAHASPDAKSGQEQADDADRQARAQREADELADADRQALNRLLGRTDADRDGRDAGEGRTRGPR